MFGSSRRHRPPAQPLNAQTANPSAATAAASAFMNRRESSSSLSSAAAAAALKALPTSPTRVGNIQTKRAVRRSASVSSRASSDATQPMSLQRKPSSSSMTDRTFRSRSPSPRRPDIAPSDADAPPVPSLPNDVPSTTHNRKAPARSPSHRKHSSLNMPGFRVASEKIGREGQPSWFGPPVGDTSNVRTSDRAMTEPYPSAAQDTRPGSRGSSVNFSYPARAKPGSPSPPVSPISPSVAASSEKSHQGAKKRRPMSDPDISRSLVYDPNSRRMVLRAELVAIEQTIQDASERPVRKKKHGPSRSNSHLSRGSVSRPKEAPRQPEPRHQQPETMSASSSLDDELHEPAVKARVAPSAKSHRAKKPISSHTALDTQEDGSRKLNVPQSSQVLSKKPSVVREEPELEQEAELEEPRPSSRQDSTSLHVSSQIGARVASSTAPHHTTEEPVLESVPEETIGQPGVTRFVSPARAQESTNPGPSAQRHETLRNERVQSNSPVRAPRFAPAPENLTVKHSPPPRSVSPRKSALKHHAPPRDMSPSDTSESSAPPWPIPENQSQEPGSAARKKSARVSFDDKNTKIVSKAAPLGVVEPDPEPTASANSKRPWYSHIGRSKKKDIPGIDEDEIIMKPRPALPSFGSVRGERKVREEENVAEERPLVRPNDAAYSPAYSETPPPEPAPATMDDEMGGLAFSNDQAIGAILSQDQTSRNAANISRYREPLPPVVTSVEGYLSSSDSATTSSESEGSATLAGSQQQYDSGSAPQAKAPSPGAVEEAMSSGEEFEDTSQFVLVEPVTPQPEDHDVNVPAISVTQPSPTPTQPHRYSPHPPGRFPDEPNISDDDSTPTGPSAPSKPLSSPSSDDLPVLGSTVSGSAPIVMPAPTQTQDESGSESSASIYSDAYEDLSDIEGGFMSIDAVVETPPSAPAAQPVSQSKPLQPIPESNLSTPTKGQPPSVSTDTTVQASPSETTMQPSPPPLPTIPSNMEDEWEHAKAYWRSLSMEKRMQLEREALEEAGVEADLDGEEPVSKAPTRKKSIERRKMESAIRNEMDRKSRQRDSERVYQIQPGSKATHQAIPSPTMRTSMRQQTAPVAQVSQGPKLRKSLRSNGSAVPAASPIPAPAPAPAQSQAQTSFSQRQKSQTGASKPGPSQAPARAHGRAMSHDTTVMASTSAVPPHRIKPSLRRQGSSDSVSSFKRVRKSPAEHGFRMSMRSPSPQVQAGGGRFRLRSLSPSGSPFRRNPVESSPTITRPVTSTGGHFRGTLRGAPTGEDPSRKGGLHMPSFGRRHSEQKHKHGFFGRNKVDSLLGDSSDEDTGMPLTFRSRFGDSSDDDPPAPARTKPKGAGMMAKTMRGGTKTSRDTLSRGKQPAAPSFTPAQAQAQTRGAEAKDEESSPSLPDSSDESAPPHPVSAPTTPSRTLSNGKTLRRNGSGRDALSSTGRPAGEDTPGARPGSSRRRASIMSVLRRKKADPEPGAIRRAGTTESWARRDTRLERSRSELAAIRGSGGGNDGKDWPLSAGEDGQSPDSSPVDENADKRLEAGVEQGDVDDGRPVGARRVSTTQGLMSTTGVGSEAGSVATGSKKKKFGKLRRMFRLDD